MAFKDCEKLCNSLHLPVQSGSDRVLSAMRRKYSRKDYLELVKKLRDVVPDIAITTDIIVGFPGETEEDFEETYRMCRELTFAGIHAFPFSARPGTEAWKMQPKVPERIAGERIKKLNELAETQAAAYLQAWDGELVCGVVEAPRNGQQTVITENYLSLPIMHDSLQDDCLHGGEYVRIRVQGKNAVLTEIIS